MMLYILNHINSIVTIIIPFCIVIASIISAYAISKENRNDHTINK
jgi:hypothetical protein